MVVLVVLRRQMYIPLKALAGCFLYIHAELCLTLFLKKKYFSPPVETMTSQIMVPVVGNVTEVFSAEIILLHVREGAGEH